MSTKPPSGSGSSSRLQAEIKKRLPFERVEEEAVLSLVRTADRFQILMGRALREQGITSSQYNVLRILRGEGAPLPILEIADRMLTVVPGITGLIDRLESSGLVARRRCTEDRRVIYVEITARGLELLASLDAPLVALQRQLMAPLTPAEQRDLIRLLEALREPL